MTTVSLCSLCYNDGELLHGLLAQVPYWSRRPDEIVLLDDGSQEPFTLMPQELEALGRVKLIRLPQNGGLRVGKHTCYSAAMGDVVIALDCDSRVGNDFVSVCLELLQDKKLGLVGGLVGKTLNNDYLSLYLKFFDPGVIHTNTGWGVEPKFVPGMGIGFRREVWEECGGLEAYTRNECVDQYLSQVVRARGYHLLLDDRLKIDQTRVLSRQSFCRRNWRWCGPVWIEQAIASRQSLPEVLGSLGSALDTHCRVIEKHQFTTVFHYFALLVFLHSCFEFCNALGSRGLVPPEAGAALEDALARRFALYPSLKRLLRVDLLLTGALPLKEVVPPTPEDQSCLARFCDWSALLHSLDFLEDEHLLEALDKHGVKALLEEEKTVKTHFSGY